MTDSSFKYYAFISYSHRDKRWGDWLHRSLETFRVPPRLVGQVSRDGKVPAKIAPIFRDREELPTASDLSHAIDDALKQSRYLVVICSPFSAQSRWVNEEILAWKRMGKANRILCLIVDGEPNASDSDDPALREFECFPPALRFELDELGEMCEQRAEPIAADARDVGDSKRDAKLKLLAGLLGVGFDALKQREMQRRNRRLAIIAVAATVLLAVTTTLAVIAVIARGQAEEAQTIAEQREVESRRMLVNSSIANGWREYDNDNKTAGLLWHAQALKQIENTSALLPEDQRTARHARIRLHYLFSHLPLPEVAVFHADLVKDAKWSSDGTQIITASADKSARVWNATTGELVGEPVIHKDADRFRDPANRFDGVNFVEISPNGRWLATGADVQGIRISNAVTGQVHIAKLDSEKVIPYSASFSPDSKWLATGVENDAVVWDVQTGKPVLPPMKHNEGVSATEFSPNGQWLATGSADKTAQIWNAKTGEAVGEPMVHLSAVDRVVWSDDSKRFATLTYEGRVRLWEAPSGKPLADTLPPIRIRDVALCADGSFIAVVMSDGFMQVYDVSKPGKPIHAMKIDGIGKSIDITRDGNRVAVAYGIRADIIDLTSKVLNGKHVQSLPIEHTGVIQAVRFSPDEKRVLTSDGRGTVRISTIVERRYQPEFLPVPKEHKVTSPRFDPKSLGYNRVVYSRNQNELFATRDEGMLVRGRRDSSGQWMAETLLHEFNDRRSNHPVDMKLHPDGRRVLVAFADTVWIVDPQTGEKRGLKDPDGHQIGAFTLSPDGTRLVMDSMIETYWDTETGEVLAKGFVGKGQTLCAFSHDSKRLITVNEIFADAKEQTHIQIWDTVSLAKPMVSMFVDGIHTLPVVSPDGKTFALAEGYSRTVTIRNIASGEPVGEPFKHTVDVLQVAFIPKSNRLLTRDAMGGIYVWDLETRLQVVPPMKVGRDLGSAAFTSDGNLMSTIGFLNIRLWDAHLGQRVWPALPQTSFGRHAQFKATDDEILVTSKQGLMWKIQVANQHADHLLLMAQWHAQQRIDSTGAAVRLRQDEVRQLWQAIKDSSPEQPSLKR